jgi:hypothetical protein
MKPGILGLRMAKILLEQKGRTKTLALSPILCVICEIHPEEFWGCGFIFGLWD